MFMCFVKQSSVINLDLFWKQSFLILIEGSSEKAGNIFFMKNVLKVNVVTHFNLYKV
jgi:hypothetical protein